MNTAIVNVKVNPEVKKRAQKVAEELGLSLSALINGYLRHLVKTKTVHFSLREEPNEYLINSIKEAKQDFKDGRTISFKTSKDALRYLDEIIEHEKKHSKS